VIADHLDKLRRSEGKVVRLTTTESETILARVVSVCDEEKDVVIDVISTNQPERYLRLGRKHTDGAWAIPFEYLARVEADIPPLQDVPASDSP